MDGTQCNVEAGGTTFMKAGDEGDRNCACVRVGDPSSSCGGGDVGWDGMVTWYSQKMTQPSVGIFAGPLPGSVSEPTLSGGAMFINLSLLKRGVELEGGMWPPNLSYGNEIVEYNSNQGIGRGEVGWFLRTSSGMGGSTFLSLEDGGGGGDTNNNNNNKVVRNERSKIFFMKNESQSTSYDEVLATSQTLPSEFMLRASLKTGDRATAGGIFMGGLTGGCGNL